MELVTKGPTGAKEVVYGIEVLGSVHRDGERTVLVLAWGDSTTEMHLDEEERLLVLRLLGRARAV